MAQPNEVSKYEPERSTEVASFPARLRRSADDYERAAPAFEGSEYYPPSWWQAAAEANRTLASEIEAIEQVSS